MRETQLIIDAAERIFERNDEVVLATVVRVYGSVYRRPGTRMLLTKTGETIGSISGGCLEGDLARKAWWRTINGSTVVGYDSTVDAETAWHLGLGCNGVVHVLLERISRDRPGPLPFLRRCASGNSAGVLATVIRADAATGVLPGERLTLDADGQVVTTLADELSRRVQSDAKACLAQDRGRGVAYQLSAGEVEVAFEVVRPPIRLIIFGGGIDVAPVVQAAQPLGWSTTVVSRRRPVSCAADEVMIASAEDACARLRPDRRTAAVVMNHNFHDDRDALAAILRSNVRYIGVLGPKSRTERMADDIGDSCDWGRLHAPVGLDVGADAPEEIAAAIVAEIIAVFAGRQGGRLRDRAGPIHHVEAELIVEGTR